MSMSRSEITKLLTDILIKDRLTDRKYFAKEVTLDYGTNHPKRVDVMQYIPKGTTYAGDIERGDFICYEIKSCLDDVYSGNGLRFYGDQNYIVTTMETYKQLREKEEQTKLYSYLKENYPESSLYVGIIVLLPKYIPSSNKELVQQEIDNPTPLDSNIRWQTHIIMPCRKGPRKRSTVELLFCMLRARHSKVNQEAVE